METGELDFLATLDSTISRATVGPDAVHAPYGGTGWRDDLTRRLRVLLHAEPFLALRAADAKQQPDRRHYDSLALALRLCDFVLLSMGLDQGVAHADVRRELIPLLTAMDAEAGVIPDAVRHEAVVDRVLGALLNEDARREQFQAIYTDIRPDGHAESVAVPFKLVEEFLPPTGGAALRLTSEAINLFLGALDRDIEDEQVAAEALIREQLERGSFAKAVRTAEYAQLQSRRYAEYVLTKIRLLRRDMRLVNWEAEVSPVIKSAHDHVHRRFTAERQILEMASEQQQRLPAGSSEARQVATVVHLVTDCCTRHAELTKTLVGSRLTFLDEQGRQGFSAAVAARRPDFVRDILEPVMQRPMIEAVQVADVVLTTIGSPRVPGLLDLNALLGWCLRPRREIPPAEVPVPELDKEPVPEPLLRFPPEVRAETERILRSVARPELLSELLAQGAAAGWSSALLDCLSLSAHLEFGRDPQHVPVLDVLRAGRRFSVAGITGDDLVLLPLPGAPSAARPAPSSSSAGAPPRS